MNCVISKDKGMYCINCDVIFEGNVCPVCGEKNFVPIAKWLDRYDLAGPVTKDIPGLTIMFEKEVSNYIKGVQQSYPDETYESRKVTSGLDILLSKLRKITTDLECYVYSNIED